MPCEPLVDEGVVSGHQIEHAAVLPQDAFEEQLGFALKRLTQVVVEVGKQIRIGDDAAEVPQMEPLTGKVADEGKRTRVGEQAAHLLAQDGRLAQTPLARHLQQLVVGNAAPEKERQTRRELEVRDAVRAASCDGGRFSLGSKHEGRTREDAAQPELHPHLEGAVGATLFVGRHQLRDLTVRYRAAIRAARYRRKDALLRSSFPRRRWRVCTRRCADSVGSLLPWR